MNVASGTPNISSKGRHVRSVNLSGGEFIVRSSKLTTSSFYVDGTLNISGTGTLNIGKDALGASLLVANSVVISGGTAHGLGRLSVAESVTQSAGDVSELTIVAPDYAMSGGTLAARVVFSTLFDLSGLGAVTEAAWLKGDPGSNMTQSGGTMNGEVTGVDNYTHSGGSIGGSVTTGTYSLTDASATSVGGTINASNLFNLSLEIGVAAVDAKLSGTGNLVKSGAGAAVLANADNDFTGTVAIDAGTLEVVDDALPDFSAVTIANDATLLFTIDDDTTFTGTMTGEGNLVKAGAATLVLTNADNDFTGAVAVDGGTLEVVDDALPDFSAVTVANDATLLFTIGDDTTFMGTITGPGGSLVKQGAGMFTLGGDVALGDLAINGGKLAVGTGTSTNLVTFESAVIGEDATLYVASGATLTILLEDGIVNNGILINDGIVNDDLHNNNTFDNNDEYNADVATNTGDIDNNEPGVWTGNVKTNAGYIRNNSGAVWKGKIVKNDGDISNNSAAGWIGDILGNDGWINNNPDANWTGDILGNTGRIANTSGTWNGDIEANSGDIINDNEADEIGYGYWNGDVVTNDGMVFNAGGGVWTGDVLSSKGYIKNDQQAAWNGDVFGNTGTIESIGIWTGDVEGNKGFLVNNGGTWTGDVVANADTVLNAGSGVWNGDIKANTGTIANADSGVWTGDVEANSGTINNGADATWAGDVETNAGQIYNHGNWEGDIQSNGNKSVNTFQIIYNDGADALWTGDVVTGATQVVNTNGATWEGEVHGNNNAIFNMLDSIWNGNVVENGGGENHLAQIDNYGDWTGAVESNEGWIFNIAGSWTGDILTNANGIFNNALDETTNPTGDNHAVWTGDVWTNDGIIANDVGGIWDGDVLENTGTIANHGTWNGNFTSGGTVNAENLINGTFDNSGVLHLTGDLAGITELNNTGTIDMEGGGAEQTLSVESAIFGADSFLDLDVDALGNNDELAVAGLAALAGVVRVSAGGSGTFDDQTVYTIVTADSISGEFADVTTDLIFLAPKLKHDTATVTLTLMRNDIGFGEVGETPNQKAAAAAAESLGAGNAIYDAILWLTGEQAADAFSDLTGEAHPSFKTALIENAIVLEGIATGRIEQVFDVLEEGGSGSSADSGSAAYDRGIWGQAYGAYGSLASTDEIAGLDSAMGGLAVGIDGTLGGWRLGLMVYGGLTSSDAADVETSIDSTDYGLGAYGGRQWGNTTLSFAALYTEHDISSTRDVGFGDFGDILTADYRAGTAQASGQLAHKLDLGSISLTPYAGLAYVSHATDGFEEEGGPAALTSADDVASAAYTTIGLGLDRQFAVMSNMLLTVRGAVGWRHAFADQPEATHAFVGGTDFSIVGAEIAEDTAMLSAGLNLDISRSTMLDIAYDGQIGDGAQTHAVKGSLATQF